MAHIHATHWRIHCCVLELMQRALTVCKLKEKGDGNADIQACDEGETSSIGTETNSITFFS